MTASSVAAMNNVVGFDFTHEPKDAFGKTRIVVLL